MADPKQKVAFEEWDDILDETESRKEEWLWDKVIPKGDVTLIAAFMKKGKTTLLTGLVRGAVRTGSYCGRGVVGARKVLYMAPEESDTVVRRLLGLGFGKGSGPLIRLVRRASPAWRELIRRYRMREWHEVVAQLQSEGFDLVVMDGLQTLMHLFEPTAKEDNEGVTQFYSNFVLPFDSHFTVVASLHTKKKGGDPRIHVPPEEMIRGASAWIAHPGQVLIMERDLKTDTNSFHGFGRYEGTQVEGFAIEYDKKGHDYRAVSIEAEEDLEAKTGQRERSKAEGEVMVAVRDGAQTLSEIQMKTGRRKADLVELLKSLEATGMLKRGPKRAGKAVWVFGRNIEIGPESAQDLENQ